MNLLDLMAGGADPDEQALDRLEGIVRRFESERPADQDEALERAQVFCCSHWGSYPAGMEAYARRVEARAPDPVTGSLAAMRWREEGEEPGMMVRILRHRRDAAAGEGDARARVVARYGSEAAARAPTPLERQFIAAAAFLAEATPDGGEPDSYGPLAGWAVPWHEVPAALRQAVADACPLPVSVVDARDESRVWQERRRELEVLGEGPGEAVLPTACAARQRLVEDLWRRDLPVRGAADLAARLEFWVERGGDDGSGYGILQRDLAGLAAEAALGAAPVRAANSGDTARRLKAAHPDWSLARIGKELGISRQAVHKHLRKGAAPTP